MDGIGSVQRENAPLKAVNARRFEIGEKARPVMAPSGLVYLSSVVWSAIAVRLGRLRHGLPTAKSGGRTHLATTCLVSMVNTVICAPDAEAR